MNGGVKYIHMAVCYVDMTGTPTVIAMIHIFLIHISYDIGVWGSVVVKALRYWSEGPGIDSRWCHWAFQ
jgi:hypothetical protein